jgi:nucleoside-diphosphate-sugar epimerase
MPLGAGGPEGPRYAGVIADEVRLDTLLSEPNPRVVETLAGLEGDIIVLGVGGKMGPTLARMARRAADMTGGPRRRVIGVSRFTDPAHRAALQAHGVETLVCDLLDEAAVGRLPTCPNVVFMAGRKFGSAGAESLTWAMNCLVPSAVCRHFEASRIVAFSTGNVYGLTAAGRGGSRETDVPQPVGEYAMSCLGRERVFEHASRTQGTRVAILRLNYAVEMRYGILVDLAQRLLAGTPIDMAMGYVNVIWQAEANQMALCALAHAASPPLVVNVAGPEEVSVRRASELLAHALGRPATFTGVESPDALLSNGALGWSLLGAPRVNLARLVDWTADWVGHGRPTYGKPTHFESRAGQF